MSRAKTPERQTELEAELALPPFPEALRYLWTAFVRLRRRTNGNGMAVPVITYEQLAAFNSLFSFGLRPWESEIIETLDDLYFAARQNQEDDPQ